MGEVEGRWDTLYMRHFTISIGFMVGLCEDVQLLQLPVELLFSTPGDRLKS